MLRIVASIIATMCFSVLAITSSYAQANTSTLSANKMSAGAAVYVTRCSLCHGRLGLGDGILAVSLKNYPSTNLAKAQSKQYSLDNIAMMISTGVVNGCQPTSCVNNKNCRKKCYMPPWKDELSKKELTDVSYFTYHLIYQHKSSLSYLKEAESKLEHHRISGQQIYRARCAFCHGKKGLGDGRMSRFIKNPPPYNLTKSVLPRAYIVKIVEDGGKAVGRSPKMPPWKDELSKAEINAVVNYLFTLRTIK